MSHRLSASELIGLVVDRGSFTSWDVEPDHSDASPEYQAELAEAAAKSGTSESIVTGAVTIQGRPAAVAVGEFRFLAGSIGRAAAQRLVAAIERATAEGLPFIAATASGGTRMQEGTLAFLQMANITQAVQAHRAAGLPYLVYLRHPTTGGVFASWGSLGHVTVAEPEALVGFLGPRVYEALYGEKFPTGVQLSENLHSIGLVDAVVPPEALSFAAATALDVLAAGHEELPETPELPEEIPASEVGDAWDVITISRKVERPSARALLKLAATSVTPLHGTGEGESDEGLLLALARFAGVPAVVLAQDRRAQTQHAPLGPAALRTARRGMRLSAELNLPLVTVIDTAGAALSKEAEEGGLAGEIARCLADLLTLPTPTACLMLGQGAGGGALALFPTDRVIAAQNAWLSPLPPEGASAILFHTTEHAPQIARDQRVRAADLRERGLVDRLVRELPDAAQEPVDFTQRIAATLGHELAQLMRQDSAERLTQRHQRYHRLGF